MAKNYGSVPSGDVETNGLLKDSNGVADDSASSSSSSVVVILECRDFGGQATVTSEIINIAKNLIGAGALSLSGGMSLYANNASAVLSATLWMLALGAMFGYFCMLIAKICNLTGRVTYREIWQDTVGNRGSLAVSLSVALKAALGNLAYASILSQTFVSLLATIDIDVSRTVCLVGITVVAILPLCLLKNLHILAPFSVLGTSGMVFTGVVMAIRYFDGTYAEGGLYHDTLAPHLQPRFGSVNKQLSFDVLPFVCMTYESYVMHYNAPRFYTELKNPTIQRFSVAVTSSFGLAFVVYTAIASFGFLTFGGNCSSYILNNYSPKDPLATMSRLAVGISTLTSYPIAFIGFRDGMLDVFNVPAEQKTSRNLNVLTLVLLALLTVIATFVTDLGLISAVGGGSLATAVVFVFPAIMYRYATTTGAAQNREALLASALAILGLILGGIGVWVAIQDDLVGSK